MDRLLRSFVRQRAQELCEYCRLPQVNSDFATFHVEHVIARQHGGPTEPDNLALACGLCNLHKGPNIASLDPEDRRLVRLFNPRLDLWDEHFAWKGFLIVGKTAIGRATIQLLAMNEDHRLKVRAELTALGDSFTG